MKKVIFSTLFVAAFSCGLFAKQAVESPIIQKGALDVSKVNTEFSFSMKATCLSGSFELDDQYCTTTSFVFCDDATGDQFVVTGVVCFNAESTVYTFLDYMSSGCD